MADRREEIVRAALALLREEGAKGLSQPQVARRAAIPQGHLTYYFPRKADLVAAVARAVQEEAFRDLFALAARAATTDEQTAATELLTALVQDERRSRALLGLTIESDRDPEVRAVVLEIMGQGRPALAALLGTTGDDPMVDLLQAVTLGLQLQQLVVRRGPAEARTLVERLVEWLSRRPGGRPAVSSPTKKKAAKQKNKKGGAP
jgi:AcrR family transcriptional regulator